MWEVQYRGTRSRSQEVPGAFAPGTSGRSVLATGPMPRWHPYPNAAGRIEARPEKRHSLATGGMGKGGIDEKDKNLKSAAWRPPFVGGLRFEDLAGGAKPVATSNFKPLIGLRTVAQAE